MTMRITKQQITAITPKCYSWLSTGACLVAWQECADLASSDMFLFGPALGYFNPVDKSTSSHR